MYYHYQVDRGDKITKSVSKETFIKASKVVVKPSNIIN